jgi:hypothetical protein
MANPIEYAKPNGSVQYLNPDTLPRNPAFTQVVVVTGSVKTVYIGMQGEFLGMRKVLVKSARSTSHSGST